MSASGLIATVWVNRDGGFGRRLLFVGADYGQSRTLAWFRDELESQVIGWDKLTAA